MGFIRRCLQLSSEMDLRFLLGGLGNWHRSWDLMQEAVPLADVLGFWGVVIPDHYMWRRPNAAAGEDAEGDSTLESWIVLTYLAARTEKLKLGTLVTPIPFRPPGLLAKMVSTLDALSSGRAILGVGAGWSQAEFEGYSEWNEPRTRVSKTEEGVQLILRLWQEEKVDFHGKFYHANGAVLDPKPVQKPYPPLLFGGFGPRLLGMAGRYADICFIPPWLKMPQDKARTIVSQEARRVGRLNKLAFAAGSPVYREKFDLKAVEKDVETAAENGSLYYVTPFPQDTYLDNMREFAKAILPSYQGLD